VNRREDVDRDGEKLPGELLKAIGQHVWRAVNSPVRPDFSDVSIDSPFFDSNCKDCVHREPNAEVMDRLKGIDPVVHCDAKAKFVFPRPFPWPCSQRKLPSKISRIIKRRKD